MSNNHRQEPASTVADDAARFAKEEILGARHWRGSKVGYLTGATAFKESASSLKDAGSESMGRIRTMFAAAFGKDRSGVAVDPTVTDPRERFIEAMVANRRTDDDVRKSIDVTFSQFWLYAALMLVCVVVGALSIAFGGFAATGNTAINVFFAVARFMPVPLLGALTLRAGWTNWAFRRRRLEGVHAYLGSGNLLPRRAKAPAGKAVAARTTKDARPTPRRKVDATRVVTGVLLVLGCAFAAYACLGGAAYAQTPGDQINNIFKDPSSTDLFMRLLSNVIPSVGPVPDNQIGSDGPYLPIKTGFFIFSGTLLFIGIAMSGWQIMSGLVASAKEGTALGRNYHEVWAPARVVIGFGMLTPMVAGMCGAQVLVLYIIAWGSNLANVVWEPYVAAVTYRPGKSTGDLMQTAVKSNNLSIANSAVETLMEKELCWATMDKANARNQSFWSNNAPYPASFTRPYSNIASTSLGALTGSAADEVWSASYGEICGTYEIRIRPTVTNSDNQKAFYSTSAEDATANRIGTARKEALDIIKGKMRTIAAEAAQTYQQNSSNPPYFSKEGAAYSGNLATQLNEMRTTYVSKITEAAAQNNQNSNSAQRFKDLQAQVKTDGWAGAGTMYLTLSRIQGNLYASAFSGIKADPVNPMASGSLSPMAVSYLTGTDDRDGVITGFRSWWNANLSVIAPDFSSTATKAGQNNTSDWISDAFMSLGTVFMKSEVDPLNPMQSMIDYGNYLTNWGVGIYATTQVLQSDQGGAVSKAKAGGAVGGAAGAVAGFAAGVFGAAASALVSLASLAALGMILAGAVHAYVIPLIPYILTTFFVASMLLLTVEALVAAPLWAFFHIRLDGQEFIDQVQRPGYMIAFNLILRPVLMIFGLILSYLTFGAMAWFVNYTYMPAAAGLAASTTVGPIGAVILVVILAYIHFQLAVKSFHLITQVPDRVSRWFGQAGERLGEEDDSQRASGLIVAELRSGTSGLGRGMGAASQLRQRATKPVTDAAAKGGASGGSGGAGGNGGGGNPQGRISTASHPEGGAQGEAAGSGGPKQPG